MFQTKKEIPKRLKVKEARKQANSEFKTLSKNGTHRQVDSPKKETRKTKTLTNKRPINKERLKKT